MSLKKGDYAKYEYSPNCFLGCRIVELDTKKNKAIIAVKSEFKANQEQIECSLDKIHKL